MYGIYRIFKNGELIAEQPNLITTRGKNIILRYLAGNLSAWAGGIGVGSGAAAPALTDNKLQFEFHRLSVEVRAADTNSSSIIIKSSVPQNLVGVVHELGLYPFAQPGGTNAPGHLILDFNPNYIELMGGSLSTNTRVGGASYRVSSAAGTTTTVTAPHIRSDFSGYGDQDTFTLAGFTNDVNAVSLRTRMKVDDANYFEYTASVAPRVEYQTMDWQKSQFVATGSPTWENVASVDFALTAAAGGASSMDLDGFRINDTDIYPDFALVSRATLTTPIEKMQGESMDIEYKIGFNI